MMARTQLSFYIEGTLGSNDSEISIVDLKRQILSLEVQLNLAHPRSRYHFDIVNMLPSREDGEEI